MVEAAGCEIFLCRDGQGSRGRGTNERTFGPDGDETADKGTWMSIWVDDVDAVHERCVTEGLEVTHPRPTSRGACANATFDIPTDTCSASARVSDEVPAESPVLANGGTTPGGRRAGSSKPRWT